MLKTYLAVMLGGAIGTALRMWAVDIITARYGPSFPVGTLLVNIVGCFVIGAFVAYAGPTGTVPATLLTQQVVTIGVLGGFTTFSSFSMQTLNLLISGEWVRGGIYIVSSVAFCLLGVWLGYSVAGGFHQR